MIRQSSRATTGVSLIVYGMPGPQGSKKAVGTSKKGFTLMVESSKKVKPWRKEVDRVGKEAMTGLEPMDGPLRCYMTFTMPKPTGSPKTRRTYPMRTPDLSKLVRATEDALTTAGVWIDDARVVELIAAKRYPGEGQDALDRPGVKIRIELIADGQLFK